MFDRVLNTSLTETAESSKSILKCEKYSMKISVFTMKISLFTKAMVFFLYSRSVPKLVVIFYNAKEVQSMQL